jgi:hypothetical protein
LLAGAQAVEPNRLTDAEVEAGWKLLFDGKTTAGWRKYRGTEVGPGWHVVDGTMTIAEPAQAGDIVTEGQYGWFELRLEFRLEPKQNSGIMFRVTEDAAASWHSGPEVQIYDHPQQEGVETTGFLYQLYKPDFDAAKPAGEWNDMTIRVAKDGCWTVLNGQKLYEWQYGSADFWERVAKSKFARYPGFAKAERGHIAIQGDHGKVAFRSLRILSLD